MLLAHPSHLARSLRRKKKFASYPSILYQHVGEESFHRKLPGQIKPQQPYRPITWWAVTHYGGEGPAGQVCVGRPCAHHGDAGVTDLNISRSHYTPDITGCAVSPLSERVFLSFTAAEFILEKYIGSTAVYVDMCRYFFSSIFSWARVARVQ